MNSNIRLVLLLIGIVVIIVCYWFIKTKIEQFKARIRFQQCEKNCTANDIADSIFVGIISNNNDNVLRLLKEIYLNAYCPSRIYIGVVIIADRQHNKNQESFGNAVATGAFSVFDSVKKYLQDKDLLTKYNSKTKNWPKNWKDHINVRELEHCTEVCTMIHILENELLRGQRFYCFMQDNCRVIQNWDKSMIQQIYQASEQFNTTKFIITHPFTQKQKHNIIKTTWPVIQKWSPTTGYPLFQSKIFISEPRKFYFSAAWCLFMSYGYSSTIKELNHPHELPYLEEGHEFVAAVYYWINGVFLLTAKCPFSYCDQSTNIKMNKQNTKEETEKMKQTYNNLSLWFSKNKNHLVISTQEEQKTKEKNVYPFIIDLWKQWCTKYTYIGVCAQTSADELTCKCGTATIT